jgi:predicted nicotinamide N-methyase
MPDAIDESRLALSSLDKPALVIRADGSQVVVHHPHRDAMQAEDIERIAQSKSNSLIAEALSKLTGVFNPDR